LMVCGLAMETNMKADLCVQTVSNALKLHLELTGAIIHSDRGSQYTNSEYRRKIAKYGLKQSMNRAGGRCHDNAHCERQSRKLYIAELRTKVWCYYMSYWNNRRICSANDGMPPSLKRRSYYQSFKKAA
ncbi:MAG: DDE-type integrase/transposase/recombinase, partial [Ruminococcus flavefaciens]|nr:DDE-type integrase/transposase/recombinase [Ruminococcus flavefaciens]